MSVMSAERSEAVTQSAGGAFSLGGEPAAEAPDGPEEEPPHHRPATRKGRPELAAPADPGAATLRRQPDLSAVVADRKAGQPRVGQPLRGVVLDDLLTTRQRTET